MAFLESNHEECRIHPRRRSQSLLLHGYCEEFNISSQNSVRKRCNNCRRINASTFHDWRWNLRAKTGCYGSVQYSHPGNSKHIFQTSAPCMTHRQLSPMSIRESLYIYIFRNVAHSQATAADSGVLMERTTTYTAVKYHNCSTCVQCHLNRSSRSEALGTFGSSASQLPAM